METSSVMRVTNEVLISFFESRREALEVLALISPPADSRARRTPAVVVSRESDGSRSLCEPPAPPPFGVLIGAGLGGLLGLVVSETGLVIGLFFGLYAGAFVDFWRTLARGDLLDEIQDGLAPRQAALVTFAGGSTTAKIERNLAATDAVSVHRFPRVPIEDDFAREVREAAADLGRLGGVDGLNPGEPDRERAIAAARRKLLMLEAIGNRLLWLERLQFGFDTGILNRELKEAPRWQTARLHRRVTSVQAAHRHARTTLEASIARTRSAEALVGATGGSVVRGRARPYDLA